MPNNCKSPEMCLLSETCVPCAICPNAKEKADDRLALTPCSPSSDTPETKDAYQQRDGEGAMAHEIRRAQTMEKLERERDELRRTNEGLQLTFELRWKADRRAIKRWQAAHPGNDLTWPDHADMVAWLMEGGSQ